MAQFDHWICTCPGQIHNHITRAKCLGCGRDMPSDFKVRKHVPRKMRGSYKAKYLSQQAWDKLKSECFKCCGSLICDKHKEMQKLIGTQFL